MKKYTGPWTEKQLKHLLRRCLFGVTLEDYNFFKGKSMEQCLEILVDTSSNPIPPIYYMDEKTETVKEYEWEHHIAEMVRFTSVLTSNFLSMINQPRNVGERMVLFWHNHFVTSYQTTKSGVYTLQYFMLLRKHVTGNFKQLLREITSNAQMLIYLNGNENNKSAPNENYARELQELFSLGKGPESGYNEDDVHAAAKVLTGWKVRDETFSTYFDPGIHDTSDKAFSAFYNNHIIKGISGINGAGETDELIEMICKQHEVSKFMCRKLYRWFVNSNIDQHVEDTIITPLAEILIKSGYEVKPVLEAMLSSDFFYDPTLVGGIIKSPIDFMIGLIREFNLKDDAADTNPNSLMVVPFWSAFMAGKMGQEIGSPPTVAGWPAYYEYPLFDKEWLTSGIFGQASWVDTVTTLDRSDPEATIHLDLIAFIKTLSNPGNSSHWLAETMNMFYPLATGTAQIEYLQKLIDTGSVYKENWNDLWAKHCADKDNAELLLEVKTRLKNTFQNLLTYPEYKIR